ncbi:MAG: alanine racemase [Promicromonosporaceae bacterium]|nr:alanine racemase [Promicromonosporaceae bacterium]
MFTTALPWRSARGAQLLVDPAAIAHNTTVFRRLLGGGEVMAVVKANGYGAGAETVARAALSAGATWLGVTSLSEALALRGVGITAPILSWLNPVTADFRAAVDAGVEVAVPSLAHLRAVLATAPPPARVHLQVDVGLAREGSPPAQWAELFAAAARAEARGRVAVVGLMGHLSCADTPEHPANPREVRRFGQARTLARLHGLRPQVTHLAATAAALAGPEGHPRQGHAAQGCSTLGHSTPSQPTPDHSYRGHSFLGRIGAGLLGLDPFDSGPPSPDAAPSGLPRPNPAPSGLLRPALTLRAPVIDLREVPAGTPVGYGGTWVAPRDTRLAQVAVGYADGIPRHLSPDAAVWAGGRRCPLVGRVSMDQVVIDLGDTRLERGEHVTFYGPGRDGEPTVAEFAAWAGTIPNEVATSVGPRVARIALPAAGRRHPPGTLPSGLTVTELAVAA